MKEIIKMIRYALTLFDIHYLPLWKYGDAMFYMEWENGEWWVYTKVVKKGFFYVKKKTRISIPEKTRKKSISYQGCYYLYK